MDFIYEINAFERWLEVNHLQSQSQLLWYKLFMLGNRSGWAEWVTVDNRRLMSMIQTDSMHTFLRARDKLVECGLVELRKGRKGHPSQYKLVPFGAKNALQTTPETALQTTPETALQPAPLYKLKQNKKKTIDPPVVPPAGEREARIDYQAVVDLFNRLCPSLPSVREISDGRKRAMRGISRAIEKHGGWEQYFRRVEASDFLAGRTGWHGCGFDWILKPANATKIIEGNYDNKQESRAREPSYDLSEEVARAFRQFGGGGIAE